MWRISTEPNNGDFQSTNPKELQSTKPSPQWLLELVNQRLIHTICPVTIMITECLKIWLKEHSTTVIAQQVCCPPQGSIWTHRMNHQQLGGKLIQIVMTTTPTWFGLTVPFGCQIIPTGGTSKEKHIQSTLISSMWPVTYFISYHTMLEWRSVFPLGDRLSDGCSWKPQAWPFAKKLL